MKENEGDMKLESINSYHVMLNSVVTAVKSHGVHFNSLRPRQNGRHFADDTFNCIFLYENVIVSIRISLKFVLKGPIDNIPALVQIMAWRRPGDKPLSEPMIVSLPMHICVTRPQWVKLLQFFLQCWNWKSKNLSHPRIPHTKVQGCGVLMFIHMHIFV